MSIVERNFDSFEVAHWPFRRRISNRTPTETIIIKLQKFLQKRNFRKPPFVVLKTINTTLFTIQFNGKHCKRHSACCDKISRTFDVFSKTLSATFVRRPFSFQYVYCLYTQRYPVVIQIFVLRTKSLSFRF